ncbi:MAG TPA: carboxypeptidase-like regulatory domain-containing protein, partial [Vicinamibacterales bacterium]|nr:carboxypeptidase-like regulatory domain-containing protein [Vicinamibacterales bacterium]
MRIAAFLVFSLALATAAAAQSSVSGVVRDEDGGVVSGASVLVFGTSGLAQQTVSGPDGRFALGMASAGDLTLVVRAGGFAEWR